MKQSDVCRFVDGVGRSFIISNASSWHFPDGRKLCVFVGLPRQMYSSMLGLLADASLPPHLTISTQDKARRTRQALERQGVV